MCPQPCVRRVPPFQTPYRLHAVLVHEGQAVSGHYWAFVYCPRRSAWLKFNDVTVTEASWAELLRDSVGGHHCTSAYCLLYVDRNNRDLFQGEHLGGDWRGLGGTG